jgi:2,5-diamino-6-(ribosylamino)-4(3H)-pyrimidinone 5'-phosphate reductase
MAKIGVNTRTEEPVKMGCSFILIDNKPHLTREGVIYLSKWVKKLFLVTTNKNHPIFDLQKDLGNIEIMYHEDLINFDGLMRTLKSDHGVTKLTIESGGELNSQWVRKNLIDHVSVVIAPCLIGGRNTSTLIDGDSLHNELDLQNIKTLKLVKCDVLENSYIHLLYDVARNTVIEA